MLAKKNRLSRGQVEFLLKKGVKHKLGNFLIIFKKNKARANRFCIIISKKLELKSVGRTSLRRKIYETIRKNLGEMEVGITLDIALGPNSKVINENPAEIEKEIVIILKNISKWAKTY